MRRFLPRTPRLRPYQRHSLVLTIAGIVYIAIGLVYLLVPLTYDRSTSLTVALRFTGHVVQPWAVAWILVGALALVSTRWPPQSKTWGYAALSGLAALWGSVYLLGVLFAGTGLTNLSGVLVWFLVATLWWAISGLVNPDDVPIPGVADPSAEGE